MDVEQIGITGLGKLCGFEQGSRRYLLIRFGVA